MSLVLIADSAGTPKDWVNFETAVCYYAKDKVVWEAGSPIREFLVATITLVNNPRSLSPLSFVYLVQSLDLHSTIKNQSTQTAMFSTLVTATSAHTAVTSS